MKKVKHYFEEQGLPFAFKKVEQGTNLFFKVKDEALAKKALERIFAELTTRPAEVASQLVKNPNVQTFGFRSNIWTQNELSFLKIVFFLLIRS